MIPMYRVLAVVTATLLLAAFATGFPSSAWGSLHVALASVATATALGGQTLVYAYLVSAARQVQNAAKPLGGPSWPLAQAMRNRRRITPFLAISGASVLVAAGLGVLDLKHGVRGPWHLAASSFAMGFGVVATLIAYTGLIAHRRLLADLNALIQAEAAEVAS